MIQIDMPMPDRCKNCRMYCQEDGMSVCTAASDSWEHVSNRRTRPEWCPLHESPVVFEEGDVVRTVLIHCPRCSFDMAQRFLLKGPRIVRCRDCKHVCMMDATKMMPDMPVYAKCTLTDDVHEPDWYCADGERRTD